MFSALSLLQWNEVTQVEEKDINNGRNTRGLLLDTLPK